MAKRHIGARTVQQVLDQAPSLALLQQQLHQSKNCLDAVRPLIAPAMQKNIHAGPIEQHEMPNGSPHYCWILLANNTAVATKLRQMHPLFLQYLKKTGLTIHEVKIQIMPQTTTTQALK